MHGCCLLPLQSTALSRCRNCRIIECAFLFHHLNFQQISKSHYFNKVRLYKSVSFHSWLSFNMYPSLWKSVCIFKQYYYRAMYDWLHYFCSVGRLSARKSVYLHQWSGVAVVTPTDRPKSVRNGCVIKVFLWHFCVVEFAFWIFLRV